MELTNLNYLFETAEINEIVHVCKVERYISNLPQSSGFTWFKTPMENRIIKENKKISSHYYSTKPYKVIDVKKGKTSLHSSLILKIID